MRVCIVSDVHYKFGKLDREESERHETILSFFRGIIGAYDILILNGDIFDLWTESRYTMIKDYFPLLRILAEIGDRGCRIVYTSGNHDFWFGDFLQEMLHAEIYPEAFATTIDKRKIIVCHGDNHTQNDTRYLLFRRIVRSPLIRELYSLLHPDLALEIGKSMSRSSRDRRRDQTRLLPKTAGLERYALRLIKSKSYDFVVMGHSHKPMHKVLASGEYLNSGDWITSFSYVNIIDGFAELCYYARKSE